MRPTFASFLFLAIASAQVFGAPCEHQLLERIEYEKNLIGDISEAREALRGFRASLSLLGKQVASSVTKITQESFTSIQQMIQKLQQQGLTQEEEMHLRELIATAKMNINEIVKGNQKDLKMIRMAVVEILDDLIYDHSQIKEDFQQLITAIRTFQENVITSTNMIVTELVVVKDALVYLTNTHANEMSITISETMEKIRQVIMMEHELVKAELEGVRVEQGKALEAIKKVLSNFNPAAHVPMNQPTVMPQLL